MELDAMISEICRKVQERVAELEKEEASAEPAAVPSEDNRPALLILAEDHGMQMCIRDRLRSAYLHM